MKLAINGKIVDARGPDGDVYTTQETKIGTWIDGKPLYRKVLHIAVAAPGVFFTDLNIDRMTYVFLMSNAQTGNEETMGHYAQCVHNKLDGTFSLGYIGSTVMQESPATVILEYTKTTD